MSTMRASMSERSIILSSAAVRRIFEGVRRFIYVPTKCPPVYTIASKPGDYIELDSTPYIIFETDPLKGFFPNVGDILNVREPWCYFIVEPNTEHQLYWYQSDYPEDAYPAHWNSRDKWESPHNMPRDANRLRLIVTDVQIAPLRTVIAANPNGDADWLHDADTTAALTIDFKPERLIK